MALLEQVTQMKNQGMGDDQIIENLQQQGESPQAIQDALSQSQVKNAVAGAPAPSDAQDYGGEYAPQTQETEEQYIPEEGYAQGYDAGYAQQVGYDQGYGGAQASGTDNMIEIAEQVFSEKIKKTDKKVNDLTEFKTLAKTKIDLFETRLKRIETMIDQLQIKILDKISGYGKDLAKTKKELSMVEDSFGKIVNRIPSKKVVAKKTIPVKKKVVRKKVPKR